MKPEILILEDDQAFAEMLVETLKANDLGAEVSLDPEQAIERVREGKFDLLVTDYLMPKLEGTTFIRRVREFNQSIPVVMISAYMGGAEIRQALQAGVTRVLKKPFSMAELMREIRGLLDQNPLLASSETRSALSTELSPDYPQPLRFLRAGTPESRQWVQLLWEASQKRGAIFVCGERGWEMDPMAAELAGWNDSDGGTVSFDFDAKDLLGNHARAVINRFAGKDRYSRVLIGRGIDKLDRGQQRTLAELLSREDSYLRQGGSLTPVFPTDGEQLAVAEIVMEENLLEQVFGNLVRVPPLRGRYRDIASYLTGPLPDPTAQGLRLSPEAAAFLLRYDWPGNYEELLEVRYRLAKRWKGAILTGEHVRSALEKGLTEPLEDFPDPSLAEVLRTRQNELLVEVFRADRKTPDEVLRLLGCPPSAKPATRFPAGQEFLFPALTESVDGD